MYRLAKTNHVFLYKSATSSVPRVCSFCNFSHQRIVNSHNFIATRQNSTTTTQLNVIDPIKRKYRKRYKKYAELLVVTDTSSENKLASVKNLSPKELAAVIEKPDISLDELYKIRNLMVINTQTKSDTLELTLMNKSRLWETTDYIEPPKAFTLTKNNVILDDIKEFKNVNCDNIDNKSSSVTESNSVTETTPVKKKKKKHEKTKQQVKVKESNKSTDAKSSPKHLIKRSTVWTKERQENLNHIVASFVDVCVHSNMENSCFVSLMYNNSGKSINKRVVTDVAAYNILMKKFAENGNYRKIRELMKKIQEIGVEANVQTYACILECLGRSDKYTNNKDLANKIINEMETKELTVNQMINECYFYGEDLLFVLKAIRLVKPKFEPTFYEAPVTYSNNLLSRLSCYNNAPISPADGLLTIEDIQKKISAQIKNEFEGVIKVKSVEKANLQNRKLNKARENVEKLENHWRNVAKESFEKKLHYLKKREKFESHISYVNLNPYLSVLKTDFYVDAIIKEVKSLLMGSEGYSPPLSHLQVNLGSYIYKKYELSRKAHIGIVDKIIDIHSKYCKWYLNRTDGCNNRVQWQHFVNEGKRKGIYVNYNVPPWPSHILSRVGRFLYDIILSDLKIDSTLVPIKSNHSMPSFYVIYRQKTENNLMQEVTSHTALHKMYREAKPDILQFDTSLLPTTCPPRPWISIHSGGYLCTKMNIIRLPMNSCDSWDKLKEAPAQQLFPAMDSLNQLASIPWRINKKILDIALTVFQKGGKKELSIPESPDSLPLVPSIDRNAPKIDKALNYKARVERRKNKNNMMSMWCDTLYKLSLANHLRDKIFWLPHNMDFRGRVYPIPPHMTHVSSDLARSMLIFAQKKPLGPNGLDRLKLHTINLTGFKKKESIQNRLNYANEVLDKILDSARNPLEGEMWWSTSDDPWQTLAACIEINEAMKLPNPENYMSGFPIHQDGSCNGLQHYAALGRDIIGAESVNLRPHEFPQDVYNSVAIMVEAQRKKDAESGTVIAQLLENYIKRKVIKQTVMTTVYGVTKYGAKFQIAKQLKDTDFPPDRIWEAAIYLTVNTFDSLRCMFKSAREIQDWFTDCAKIISDTCEKNVEWVTPLGLPIVQPYTKQKSFLVPQSKPSLPKTTENYPKPNVMKQRNAFPPNFVHSLDSTHMMLTSLHCENVGMTFVSVHDCFWTHCITVEAMSKICREQFIALHSQPILEDLSNNLKKSYGVSSDMKAEKDMKMLSKIPNKGNFNLKEVMNSVYFFS